jgi:hypothetical protein
MRRAAAAVKRIGNELLDEKKNAASDFASADNSVDTRGLAGRDILSVLGMLIVQLCAMRPEH